MKDTELLTAMREALPGIRLETTLEETVRRGRTLRIRRRARGAAAIAGAAALASFVAVAATGGGGTQPGGKSALAAAWTVARGPGDTVTVTIRQLRDAAGLQRTLREDGIPARVEFAPKVPLPGPAGPPGSASVPLVDPGTPAGCTLPNLSLKRTLAVEAKILGSGPVEPQTGVALHIHVGAIPAGIGIFISSDARYHDAGYGFGLVTAAPSCTGG